LVHAIQTAFECIIYPGREIAVADFLFSPLALLHLNVDI